MIEKNSWWEGVQTENFLCKLHNDNDGMEKKSTTIDHFFAKHFSLWTFLLSNGFLPYDCFLIQWFLFTITGSQYGPFHPSIGLNAINHCGGVF